MKNLYKKITLAERFIWGLSVAAITVCFFAFGNKQYLYLIGAFVGVTALIFVSKGNPIGQVLTIVFSVFYGIVSYSFAYYGEMITYLAMSAPMALLALISWLRHPYKGDKSEVKINVISAKEWAIFSTAAIILTFGFYFILRALNTSNLIVSTVSVLTSLYASYLTARRSKFYALFYAGNDVVLIALWALASRNDLSYLAMAVCFAAFFALDIYGFINWSRINKKQQVDTN